jgi:hypothetical protein
MAAAARAGALLACCPGVKAPVPAKLRVEVKLNQGTVAGFPFLIKTD